MVDHAMNEMIRITGSQGITLGRTVFSAHLVKSEFMSPKNAHAKP